METLNQMNPVNLILITAIACFAIALVITLVVFFFVKRKEADTPCVDRYVYPKKEEFMSEELYAKELARCNREREKHLRIKSDIDIKRLNDNFKNMKEPIIDKFGDIHETRYAKGSYVKPTHECECDCLGECKTEHDDCTVEWDQKMCCDKKLEHNGKLADVYLNTEVEECYNDLIEYMKQHTIKTNECELEQVDSDVFKRFIDYPLNYYMKRGNKRYYRGENVKVVVTVKDNE